MSQNEPCPHCGAKFKSEGVHGGREWECGTFQACWPTLAFRRSDKCRGTPKERAAKLVENIALLPSGTVHYHPSGVVEVEFDKVEVNEKAQVFHQGLKELKTWYFDCQSLDMVIKFLKMVEENHGEIMCMYDIPPTGIAIRQNFRVVYKNVVELGMEVRC